MKKGDEINLFHLTQNIQDIILTCDQYFLNWDISPFFGTVLELIVYLNLELPYFKRSIAMYHYTERKPQTFPQSD